MSDKEQATMLIDAYVNLLRMEKAEDRDIEIANQKSNVRAKLETLGVAVENIVIR